MGQLFDRINAAVLDYWATGNMSTDDLVAYSKIVKQAREVVGLEKATNDIPNLEWNTCDPSCKDTCSCSGLDSLSAGSKNLKKDSVNILDEIIDDVIENRKRDKEFKKALKKAEKLAREDNSEDWYLDPASFSDNPRDDVEEDEEDDDEDAEPLGYEDLEDIRLRNRKRHKGSQTRRDIQALLDEVERLQDAYDKFYDKVWLISDDFKDALREEEEL